MNFSCDKCQRRYSIADEKVRGKTLKIRCKNCQNFISLVGPPEEVVESGDFEEVQSGARAEAAAAKNPWAHETTRPVGLDPKLEWFAMVRGEQVGPLNGPALMAKVVAGEIDHRTYVWREGLGEWKRAGEVPELAAEMVQHQEEPRAPATGPVVPPVTPQAPAAQAQQANWSVHVEQSFQDEAAAKGMPLGMSDPLNSDIFKGIDLKGTKPAPLGDMDLPTSPQMDKQRSAASKPNDPFAALGDLDPSKIAPSGENTSYYIAKSGVKDRNPPWKIAAFVAAAILVPTGLLYALSALKVVPLEVTHVNEQGQEVKDSVFSAGGVSGLRDVLLGKKRQPLRPPELVVKAQVPKVTGDGDEGQPVATKEKGGADGGSKSVDGIMDNLAAIYADPKKLDVGPKVRQGEDVVAHSTTPGEGPPDADVAKVVGQMQPAFQFCIEQEMKKNPSFKGGKINIVATVGSSGTVKHASIDRRDIDSSGLGDCLKAKARRMVFTAFEGDDVELQIPLILTTTM